MNINMDKTSEVILYTIGGGQIKTTLTNSAKRDLIRKISYTTGLQNAKGSLVILDQTGKEIHNIPLNKLLPYLREL